MKARPRLTLALSTADKLMEVCCWLTLLILWIYILVSYPGIPDTIPIHFNGSGKADGFGSKSNIFIMPVFAVLLVSGLTLLNRYPHLFNYPVKITEDNARKNYTLATRMIRILKLGIVASEWIVAYTTVNSASPGGESLIAWLIPALSLLVVLPVAYLLLIVLRKVSSPI